MQSSEGELSTETDIDIVPPPPQMPTPSASGLAQTNGILMYYAAYGSGDPVLLVHGGLGHADIWANLVSDLMKDHQVIVADSRGHGRSTRPEGAFHYRDMARDYVALLDFLHLDAVSLVGWSDGGIIGLDIAINYPRRLTRLFSQAGQSSYRALKPTFGDAKATGAYVAMVAGDYAKLSPTPDQFETFIGDIVAMYDREPDYSDQQLSKITVPTTIAVGEHDEGVMFEHTKHLAETIPNARLVVEPGVGHFWLFQNPRSFVSNVRNFLSH